MGEAEAARQAFDEGEEVARRIGFKIEVDAIELARVRAQAGAS